ncbi:MAG TPA: hypothetical protein VIW24_22640 [Aldersonia sp.]
MTRLSHRHTDTGRHTRPGELRPIRDKTFHGKVFEANIAARGITLLRPAPRSAR